MDNNFEKLAFISQVKVNNIDKNKVFALYSNNPQEEMKRLFIITFGIYPNVLDFGIRIEGPKLRNWLMENYSEYIKDCFYMARSEMDGFHYYYFSLFEDTFIYHNHFDTTIYYRKTDIIKIQKLVKEIKQFKRKPEAFKPEISMIYNSYDGLDTISVDINRPKLSLNDNYNNDFQDIHKVIIKRLRKKNDKGLVLLHGKPGTGKTSYLRYLITQTKKEVIFLPPNMAVSITEPGFIELLSNNTNSIFVIEDAENILIDREQSASSAVSALLNITDGLLSDSLNIQVICTFNTDISRLDSALLRKGRLIAKYEFNELETEKAQALSNKLGFNSVITKPMTLTDIYNQKDKNYTSKIKSRRSVGFNTAI